MNKNFYTYYIFKDKNLVIEILRGNFDISDFVNLKKLESEDPDFDPNYNTILDIRDVENEFTQEIRNDLEKYLELIKTIQRVTKRKKTAVVTNTPPQVTGITWYTLINDRSIDYQVFSTHKAATEWLGISEIGLKDTDPSLTDS
jgi:hypothetical protein